MKMRKTEKRRKHGDWKRVVRESEAAIAVGAYFSPQVVLN